MAKVLKIRMNLSNQKILTWTLKDPINNLTLAQVETTINSMISDDAIRYLDGTEPESFKDAYYYETETTYLE